MMKDKKKSRKKVGKGKGSRGKPKVTERRPLTGSLAFYRASWREALGPLAVGRAIDAAVDELARLSHENQAIRRRLHSLETVMTGWVLGMVEIKGDMHLLECGLRDGTAICTCGAVPAIAGA